MPKRKTFNILHLSDFHRDGDFAFDPTGIVTGLMHDLDTEFSTRKPDMIVVSGDLVHKGESTTEYDVTSEMLSILHERLFPEHKEKNRNLFFVPGNHDVDWTKCCDAEMPTPGVGYMDPPHTPKQNSKKRFKRVGYKKKFANFGKFQKEMMGEKCSNIDEKQFWARQVVEAKNGLPGVVFIGLNTAYIVNADRDEADLCKEACATVADKLQTDYSDHDNLVILLMHHGFMPSDKGKVDYVEMSSLSKLVAEGVGMILHGHMHRHVPLQLRYAGDNSVPIIGAGALNGPDAGREHGYGLEYNIISIELDTGIARVYPRTSDKNSPVWRAENRWCDPGLKYYKVWASIRMKTAIRAGTPNKQAKKILYEFDKKVDAGFDKCVDGQNWPCQLAPASLLFAAEMARAEGSKKVWWSVIGALNGLAAVTKTLVKKREECENISYRDDLLKLNEYIDALYAALAKRDNGNPPQNIDGVYATSLLHKIDKQERNQTARDMLDNIRMIKSTLDTVLPLEYKKKGIPKLRLGLDDFCDSLRNIRFGSKEVSTALQKGIEHHTQLQRATIKREFRRSKPKTLSSTMRSTCDSLPHNDGSTPRFWRNKA